MKHQVVSHELIPRHRLRWGRVLSAASLPTAIGMRYFVVPGGNLHDDFVVALLIAAISAALGVCGYGWNVVAKRQMMMSVEDQTDSGAAVFAVRKCRELTDDLSAIDEYAGSQIKQRFCNYGAFALESDGLSIWDCQRGATLLAFWDWSEISSVTPVHSESTFDITRALRVTFENGQHVSLVLLDSEFLNLDRALGDVRFRELLLRCEAGALAATTNT